MALETPRPMSSHWHLIMYREVEKRRHRNSLLHHPDVTRRPIFQKTARGLKQELSGEDSDPDLDTGLEDQQEGVAARPECQLIPELICPAALGQCPFNAE